MRKSYPNRYGKRWPTTSKKARAAINNRCALCWTHEANEVHHLHYSTVLRGRIAGKEIIGWDVIPLCADTDKRWSCHDRVHRPDAWLRSGEWTSHNYWWIAAQLRINFWLLRLWFSIFP